MAQQARLISVVLLFLTLAAGFMLGMAWDSRRSAPAGDVEEVVVSPTPETGETEEEEGAERQRGPVIYEIGMEPEQRAAVDEIIVHFRSSMNSLRGDAERDYDRKRRGLILAIQDSIKAVLNPDQVAEYDSLLAVRYSPNRGSRRDSADDERPGEREGQ
jgi:hypothetical protein